MMIIVVLDMSIGTSKNKKVTKNEQKQVLINLKRGILTKEFDSFSNAEIQTILILKDQFIFIMNIG